MSNAQTSLFGCLPQKGIKRSDNFEMRKYDYLWRILVVWLLLWLIPYLGGSITTSLVHRLLIGAIVILAINLFSPGSKLKRITWLRPEKESGLKLRFKAC